MQHSWSLLSQVPQVNTVIGQSTNQRPLHDRKKKRQRKRALQIDLSQFRQHNEFNADENEAVRDRRTVFTMASAGPRSHNFYISQLLKLFCLLKVFFVDFFFFN